MTGDAFSAMPLGPECPRCHIRFNRGDSVRKSALRDEGDPQGDREHVDCDNPSGAVDTVVDRIKKKVRGEQT